MAILTGLPLLALPGIQSGNITLSSSDLITDMSITDPYWSVASNWSSVQFSYLDATGSQVTKLFIPTTTNQGVILVSAYARQNDWEVQSILIRDHDGGTYLIPRASFPVATEFDVEVGTGLVTPQLHFDPSKANAGSPYTSGTDAQGASYTEQMTGNTGTVAYCPATPTGQWRGTGIPADPYRLIFSNDGVTPGLSYGKLTLNAEISAPATDQAIQFWSQMDTTNFSHWMTPAAFPDTRYTYFLPPFETRVGNSDVNYVTLTTVPTGAVWRLYTVTKNSSGVVNIYIDGVLLATATNISKISPTPVKYVFGANDTCGIGNAGPCGPIGDIWIFDQALTAADALDYYNATKATYGL